MNNDKDLFGQLDELFAQMSLDEASNLIGEQLEPTQEDYEKELIEKLNNNEIELTDDIIDEIRGVITEGGDVDQRITAYLKNRFDIQEEVPVAEQYIADTLRDYNQEELKEEIIQRFDGEDVNTAINYIDNLAGSLSQYIKKQNLEPKPEVDKTDSLVEKVEYLTSQLGIIRQTLDEQGKTIVSGIGQGGDGQLPGSGEVRLQKQDDVDMDGIKPGQTLCWDPDMYSGTGGWYPCDGGGGSGGGGTIQPATNGVVFGCKRVKECPSDLYWGTQQDYETWYNGGAVDGPLTDATLVQTRIKAISGCVALEYTNAGLPGNPLANTSDAWYAVGAVDCDDNILDVEDISTPGTSGPAGPEGYFLVYYDPDGCGEGQQGCEALPIDYLGCSPVLPIDENNNPDGYTNELRYGDEADYDADPQGGEPVLDSNNNPIEGVTAILAATFEGCDRDTMEGKYNVYYQKDGKILLASYTDDQVGADERTFFIANANCDTTVEPPEEQEQILGCLAAEGCKEVAGDPDQIGQVKFGDPNGTSENVTDDAGVEVDDAQKLLFAVSKKDVTYTIDEVTGEITAVWVLTYQDFAGNTKQVEWEGTIDVTTCEVGFFIESANECLNPGIEEPEEGDQLPWPGLITGCKEIDPNLTQGNLMFGDGTTGINAVTEPLGIVPVTDAQRIIYVYSVYPGPPAVDEDNKIGIWECIYKNFAGEFKIGYTNTSSADGGTYGFYIETTGPDQCIDDSTDFDVDFGIFTGCREPVTAGPLYWGLRSGNTAPGEQVKDHNGVDITACRKVYRPMTIDGDQYFGIYINNLDGRAGLAVHPQDGSTTSSPPYGFYTLGACNVEDEEDTCPTDQKIYAPPMGCREVAAPGTDLLFGTETTAEVVDTEVIKILSVYTEDLCDNNYGVWQCVYVKLVGDVEELRLAERNGFNPADPVEDSESFYLDTTNVECLEDPDAIDGGKPVAGLITGCRRTLESAGTTLHWGDGTDTSEIVKDVNGNDVTDAKFIVGVVSLNSDTTKFGDWICMFRRADGSYDTAITYGQSPTDGYFLEGSNCDPDDCRDGGIYFGYLPDCNRVDENFEAGELYWNNGDDDIANVAVVDEGGTQILSRKVLATFTLDNCDDAFDITGDLEWFALYFDENNKVSLTGTQLGKSPLGGYYIEVDEVNSFCAYEDSVIGGQCEDDNDCPLGFICVGGICEQIRCNDGDDCPNGFDCVNGVCLKPCGEGEDALCPPGFHCQQIGTGDLTYCIPGPGCNGDCPEGYFCLNGECVILECPLNSVERPDDTNCPPGYDCHLGQCLKPCPGGDSECPPGFFCTDGHCFPIYGPCPPEGCPPGYECVLGACRPACNVDGNCPAGFLCFNGHCFPECPPEGCPEGHRCIAGICFPIYECGQDTDCGGNFECINGICLPPCNIEPDGSDNCPPGFTCFDHGNGTNCFPSCETTDCPPGFECFAGVCLPPFVCDDGQGGGRPCPPGWGCTPEGICRPLCPNGDSDCPDGTSCIGGHCWQACDDTNPCPPGFYCDGGKCIPEIECNPNRPCPTGFECVGGICREICTDTTDCPDGFQCWNGHCLPECPPEGCPPGHNCIAGICVPTIGCDDTTDCPTGYQCVDGICFPGTCTDTADCPDGTVCIDGICRPTGPDRPCNEDADCPDGFECIDGFCRRECSDKPCPPGYICIAGNCFPGIPEGPCADGVCPPGYECFMGICRPPCDPVDGSCPPLFECNDPPGGCWPKVCTDDTDCGPDGICVDGRCRQICNDTKPCPDGYNCVEILPGVSVCLPITIDPDGPEQPVDPGPKEHPKVGCEQVDKCGYLYWGSDEDYASGTGELQQDANGPIEVSKIDLVVATNVYPNGFGTYTVYYRDCDTDEIHVHSVYKQSPEGGLVQSFFIKPADGSICINFGETHDPVEGLIAGCKETDRGGTLHWGTIPEGINEGLPNPPLTYEDGTNIIAKGIMSVFSIDCVDPEDGDPGQVGIWNIIYQLMSGQIEVTKVYGRSGPQGPEGAFMRAAPGSVCIDNNFDLVSTRDVILVNSPRVMETRKQFLGKSPQGTADILGPDGEIIRYETQEQANLLNLDLLSQLQERKPTINVVPDINQVISDGSRREYYLPRIGDLWVDPRDYSIYMCDYLNERVTPEEIFAEPDHHLVWVELGAASGGGTDTALSGSNIFLQDDEPPKAIVKHADIWIDAETYLMYTYNSDSKSWISVTGDIKAVLDNRFEVYIDQNPPPKANTKSGDLWFDSEVAEMRVAYIPDGSTDFVWVPVQGTGHKAIPQFVSNSSDDVEQLQAQIASLSARLTALEASND